MTKEIKIKLRKATSRSPHRRHMVGAVIVSKSGEILSDGCAHVSDLRLSELASIHAEIHALGRGRHRTMQGATAYVMAQARKSGNTVVGKPCLVCAIAMRSAGIEKVVYSINNNDFAILDLESDLSKLKVYRKEH